MTHQVLLFYKYVTIEDPHALKDWFRNRAEALSFTGRALIAEEGINATVEGTTEATERFAKEIQSHPLFTDISIKRSEGTGSAFPKLSVKVRNEIVGTRFPVNEADPRVKTAPRISAEELKKWYQEQKDFVIVDMRNDYEFQSGHFKNSINPGLNNSRDLAEKVADLEPLKDKKVLTVCTGGVRCEKMSAYLMSHGFKDVYQLEDGMHDYMQKYPGEDFVGTLYTFDGRVTMDFGGNREVIGTCYKCETSTEKYVNCANPMCHLHFLVCDSCIDENGAVYCSDACATAGVLTT